MRATGTRAVVLAALAYAAVFIALGITVNRAFFLPVVAAVFARPIARELGLLGDRDEWQRYASYWSSHIAFLVAMFIGLLVLVKEAVVDEKEPSVAVMLIVLLPLLLKFVTLRLKERTRRKTAIAIAWLIGGAWFVFSALSHGLSIDTLVEGAIWAPILGAALLARRLPRLGGAILFVEGLVTLYFFVLRSRISPSGILMVALFLPLPVLLAGALLLIREREDAREASQVSDS
jgi:hypothetical protein